jgi:hypothetical protein
MSVFVVFDDRQHLHLRARRSQDRGNHRAVRLVDLAVVEGLTGSPELASGRKNRHAWTNRASNLGDSGRGKSADLRGTEPRARFGGDLARPNVATAWADVLPEVRLLRDLDSIAPINQPLDGDDGVSPVRHRSTGRDPGCSPGGKRYRRWAAGRNPKRDWQFARSLVGSYGKSVHGRARERWQIHSRQGRRPENASCRVRDGEHLRRERLCSFQDARERIFERQEAGHRDVSAS